MYFDMIAKIIVDWTGCDGSAIHPNYKEKILKAGDLCTMVTGKRLGHPVRSLRTPFARNYPQLSEGQIWRHERRRSGSAGHGCPAAGCPGGRQ